MSPRQATGGVVDGGALDRSAARVVDAEQSGRGRAPFGVRTHGVHDLRSGRGGDPAQLPRVGSSCGDPAQLPRVGSSCGDPAQLPRVGSSCGDRAQLPRVGSSCGDPAQLPRVGSSCGDPAQLPRVGSSCGDPAQLPRVGSSCGDPAQLPRVGSSCGDRRPTTDGAVRESRPGERSRSNPAHQCRSWGHGSGSIQPERPNCAAPRLGRHGPNWGCAQGSITSLPTKSLARKRA